MLIIQRLDGGCVEKRPDFIPAHFSKRKTGLLSQEQAALRHLVFYVLLLAVLPVSGQVLPPDFQCNRTSMGSEVLNWANTLSTCGPFEATEIFTAPSAAGPFTLLAEITDPNQTTFADPNPASELRFYFIRHRYACPGVEVLNSDTLDNLIPVAPQLAYVGLEDGDIVVEWLPSVSPEVDAYIILEQLPSGNVAIDTVFGATRFELPVQPGDPPATERSFLLVALDPCNNDSPQGRTSRAMTLAGTGGFACTETITLEVDQAAIMTYLPVSLLELFVSVDGGAFISVGTFPPNATTVTYTDANDGEDLVFYVEAVLAADRGRGRSETFRQLVSFNQPVRDFPLFGAEVNAAGEIILQYGNDGTQPVADQASLRITRGSGQTEAVDLPTFSFGTGTVVAPPPVEPLRAGDVLSLRITDNCMREVTTNTVAPVFLTARALFVGQNRLEWTPFVNNLTGDFSYTVARAFVADEAAAAGAMYEQIAVDINELSLADDTSGEDGIPCYQVSVRFIPEGGGTALFRSNISCVLPRTEVFVPNAFSPQATQADNLTFRPRFSRLPPAEGYLLRVYDRWGGLLFETTDPAAGWAGDSNGQDLPAGTFLFQLSFTTLEGNTEQRAGTINLLR